MTEPTAPAKGDAAAQPVTRRALVVGAGPAGSATGRGGMPRAGVVLADEGVGPASLEHRADDVVARLSDGTAELFDIIVGADGLHSTVRNLALPSPTSSVCRNDVTHVWINRRRPAGAPA